MAAAKKSKHKDIEPNDENKKGMREGGREGGRKRGRDGFSAGWGVGTLFSQGRTSRNDRSKQTISAANPDTKRHRRRMETKKTTKTSRDDANKNEP